MSPSASKRAEIEEALRGFLVLAQTVEPTSKNRIALLQWLEEESPDAHKEVKRLFKYTGPLHAYSWSKDGSYDETAMAHWIEAAERALAAMKCSPLDKAAIWP